MEKMIITDVNFIKEDWGLFLEISMAAAQMDPNNQKTVSWPCEWKKSP